MHNFIESLLSLSPANLRYLSALFSETSPSNVIMDTVSDLATGLRGAQKAQDAFIQRVTRTANARRDLKYESILFDFFLEMIHALELDKIELGTEAGLADLSRRIEAKAIELYRVNNTRFAGETIDEFYTTQLTELLDDMRIVYIDMPDDQQLMAIQQILDYFESLPEEQQERVCKALDCTALTTEVLHAAMLRRILVRVFIEEIGLDSLVGRQSALLSDNLFIAAVLGEEGKKLIRTQNRQLQQRVLPILVALILLGETEPQPIERARAAIMERWRNLYGEYRQEEQWHTKVSGKLRRAEEKLEEIKAKKKALDADLREENTRYNQIVKLVAEHLATERSFIEELAEQGPIAGQAQQYLSLDAKTAERELQKRQEQAEKAAKKRSFLEKTWSRVKSLGGAVVKVKDQRAMTNMLQSIARDLLMAALDEEPEWLGPFKRQAAALQTSIAAMQSQSRSTQSELEKAERLRSELQSSVNASYERLKDMNKEYPALAAGIPWPEEQEPAAEIDEAAEADHAVEADQAAEVTIEPVQIEAAQEEYPQPLESPQTPTQWEPTQDAVSADETEIDPAGEVCG
ncbi:MAG: hypothetical protein ACOX44_15830 [Limnochordia bacterium]|jgi:hypothetical protein